MQEMNIELLYQLLRCCVDKNHPRPDLTQVDWDALYTFSKQQAITGVMFDMLMRMGGKETGIERRLFLRWFQLYNGIQKRNKLVNKYSVQIVQAFEERGFKCCLLKGQGNASMYHNPTARVSGDIDLLIIPKGLSALPKDLKKRRHKILNTVRKKFPKIPFRYHHVDFPIIKGLPIELHFIPCLMNNMLYNRRIQQWLGERAERQYDHRISLSDADGTVPVPTLEYNIVFQMAHLMHHFFDEGIGLRQMMDYYYLLRKVSNEESGIDRKGFGKTLKYLNLYRFSGAVMYVMREAFGMPEEWMIAPVDERRGKTLMAEILRGGNFGHYSGLTKHGSATKYFLKHWRNIQLALEYPTEALSEPIFRTWHFFWRLKNKK